ncbi:MAG: dihydropteroate synthase [Armatimonadota bacterium]|nr:MAG: dihydropteroate synthase [Armatimonadota bacterium]
MITVVGERLNSTRDRVAAAIAARDEEFVRDEAIRQSQAGADFIDVNAAARVSQEIDDLKWMIGVVQDAVDAPPCIDSPDPKAIAAGLEAARGEAMINSITADPERAERLLPLVRERGARVVGLTMSEKGLPTTAADRRDLAVAIADLAAKHGVATDRLYIDPLVRPVSTEGGQGREFLEAVRAIRDSVPGVHVVCGLSNVSFGLPQRHLLNRTFLAMALAMGLDAAIVDPLDDALMATLRAGCALLGTDEYCAEYLSAHRAGLLR